VRPPDAVETRIVVSTASGERCAGRLRRKRRSRSALGGRVMGVCINSVDGIWCTRV